MKNDSIVFNPIGVVHSPHTQPEKTPIQPRFARSVTGRVTLNKEFEPGLKDITGFSHIYLIYYLHRSSSSFSLEVTPCLDDTRRGLFATRAPSRPNRIGISVVRLLKRSGCTLFIENVDILDSTPLLDIKPYIPLFESENVSKGWTENLPGDKIEEQGSRGFS